MNWKDNYWGVKGFNPHGGSKEYKLIAMAVDPLYDTDPIEKDYGTTTSIKEANEFIDEIGDETDGGRVEYNGKIVGYSWGEKVYVELDSSGEPIKR